MERRENSGSEFDAGFSNLICEEDLHDQGQPPYPRYGQNKQQASIFTNMTSLRHGKLSAVSLVLLAVVLLIVDISLGVHYNKLIDTHLAIDDVEGVEKELNKLQGIYMTAIETMKGTKKQLDSEMSRQKQTTWELEHQIRREKDYEAQIDKMTKDIASMRYLLPMINGGCRHCPPGWILMNSMCYYFPFSEHDGLKTWQGAREFCQMHGGELGIIDSKDKQNFTVNMLINNNSPSKPLDGFWFGLRDLHDEGTWQWVDGSVLVEGYWKEGEPNNSGNEDCAVVLPRENFFNAWNDLSCDATRKWICEKAPTNK